MIVLAEQFWAQVEKTPDCWIWRGGKSSLGYGGLWIRERSGLRIKVYAHRVAYELSVGAIPEGLSLDHVCHTRDLTCAGGARCHHRRCVRPDHLEPVTNKVNALRGRSGPADNARKQHCPSGHTYDERNTRYKSNGWRVCRTCHRIAENRRHATGVKYPVAREKLELN